MMYTLKQTIHIALLSLRTNMQGPEPQILYCQHGGTSVRLVYTVMPAPIAGKKSVEKQGAQLKGDNKKPIVAMAAHPSGAPLSHLAHSPPLMIPMDHFFVREAVSPQQACMLYWQHPACTCLPTICVTRPLFVLTHAPACA